MAKLLKNLSLSSVSLDGIVLRADTSSIKETSLAIMFMCVLSNLTMLSLNNWRIDEGEAVEIGQCIRDKHAADVLELAMKNVPSQIIRLIIHTAGESGKINVTFSNGNIYRFKKTGKVPSFLDKMMCITSWKA